MASNAAAEVLKKVATTATRIVFYPTLHGRTPDATTQRVKQTEASTPTSEVVSKELKSAFLLSLVRFVAAFELTFVYSVLNSNSGENGFRSEFFPFDSWLYVIPLGYLAEVVFNGLYMTYQERKNRTTISSNDK